MKHRIFSAASLLVASLPLQAQLSQEDFRNPPLKARPSGLWAWLNGHVDHAQITRELEEMKAKGMRGGIIWDVGSIRDPDNIIPAGPGFLGPESIEAIHHAMDEAERLGLELGLFGSSSWNAAAPGSPRRTPARHCFSANSKSMGLANSPENCRSRKKPPITTRMWRCSP